MQPAGNVEPAAVHTGHPQVAAACVENDSKVLGGCAQANGSIVLQGGSTRGGAVQEEGRSARGGGGSTTVSVDVVTHRLLLPVSKMTVKCWAGVLRPAAP